MFIKTFLFSLLIFLLFQGCKKSKKDPVIPAPNPPVTTENVIGFSILAKLSGIWNGPVSSTTALGSFSEWIVDFRPVSENQISAKNELDFSNDIHMSFFAAKFNNENRIAFRNGGKFGGNSRVSYFLVDSVVESGVYNYYRFSEVIKGRKRAYTTVEFKQDSLIMKTYTNVYNTQAIATPHMSWKAKLKNSTAHQVATTEFAFPKSTLTKNFSTTFVGLLESIYFSLGSDPYSEAEQPYLGKSNINYSFASGYTPNSTKKVFIFMTTQPFFVGNSYDFSSLDTRSRYVIIPSNQLSFEFNYMHPGGYYLYACYDNDGNGIVNSGDWMSLGNTTFTVPALGTVTSSCAINFVIP